MASAKDLQAATSRRQQERTVEVDAKWLLKTRRTLEQENDTVWRDRNLLWELIFAFVEGKALGRRGKNGGWRWSPLPKQTDQPVYGLNLARFYSRNVKAKWVQSNTDVVWRPVGDSDKTEGAAKAATRVTDYYRRKLYTETFRQIEAMAAQCGKYARYYYVSEDCKRTARKARIEKQQLQFGDGVYLCPDCGQGGNAGELQGRTGSNAELSTAAGDFGAFSVQALGGDTGGQTNFPRASGAICPTCGSPNVAVESASPIEVESVASHDEYETGDIVCESVPVFELKHDIGMSPQDSPYLIRRRRVRTAVLQSKFPQIQISPAKSDDDGMRAQSELKHSSYSQTRFASAGDTSEPVTELVQVWLDPSMYAQCVLAEDWQTVGGDVLPKGTRLLDMFPTGMYQCWIEGVSGIVEWRDEHHKDFWVGGEYDMVASNRLGAGLEDIVQAGMQYNLIMSMIYTQLRSATMPATLYEQKLLPGGASSYLGSLANIPVDTTTMDGKSLRDVVHQLQPQPPSGQNFSYAQQVEYVMQKGSMVTDFSGGLPGVNNSTATGVQVAAANSQGLFAPQLALKAEVDRRGAEIVVELFRKNTPDDVYVALSGKRGETDGEWMNSAAIGIQMFAEVVADSYLPQTNLERRQRLDDFLQRVGGLPGLKMAMQDNPAFVELMAELCDVDLGDMDYTNAAEICRLRVDQMKAAEPALQQWLQGLPPTQVQSDPMTGLPIEVPLDPEVEAGQFLLQILHPPIEKEELGHLSAIYYLRSLLTEDEGLAASPLQRAGWKAMIGAHIDGLSAEAQITGMVGMAAQPMMPPMNADGGPPPMNANPDAKQMQPGGGRANPRDSQTKAIVAAKGAA